MKQQADPVRSTVPSSEGRRLTLLYIVALSTVAMLSIGAQWLVQRQLDRGERDSQVINIAGRQRMLSQQLTKTSLQLAHAQEADKTVLRQQLSRTLDEWRANHSTLGGAPSSDSLSRANSPAVEQLFNEVDADYQAMLGAGKALQEPDADIKPHLATMEQHEGVFLEGMDRIVSQYVLEAEAKVRRLRRLEMLLLVLTLAVLLVEGLIVFRPAVRRIEQTVATLARTTDKMIEARDEAEEASAAKSRFLASISHELRTPMTAVLGMAELARETDDADKREEYLAIIHDAGSSLLVLLNDLIDVAAIDANEIRLVDRPFAPREVGLKVTKLLRPLATAKGLELRYIADSSAETVVLGDAERTQQVLVNLVANAIKYTEQGHVTIECETRPDHNDRYEVRWTVRDTGGGIRPSDQQRVFEPFTQVCEPSATSPSGVGLGLSICKRIAETMGGDLKLESQLGVGTCVRFSASVPVVASVATVDDVASTPHVRPLRILVIEDTEVNQILLRELLTRHGHRVSAAASGEEAIECCRHETFDCVLIDMQLPGIDGLETRRLLQAMDDESNRTVPKLCITAQVGGDNYGEFDGVIGKPFASRDLLMAIQTATNGHEWAPADSKEFIQSDLQRELAEAYLQVAATQAEGLRAAVAERQWAEAKLLAHRLRGQVEYFTSDSLVELLKTLESACEAPDGSAATDINAKVQPLLSQLQSRLEHQCAALID